MLKLNSVVVAKIFFGVPCSEETYPTELDEIFTMEGPGTVGCSKDVNAITATHPKHGGSLVKAAPDRSCRFPPRSDYSAALIPWDK